MSHFKTKHLFLKPPLNNPLRPNARITFMKKIGLIAGGGKIPIYFARAVRGQGAKVLAIALAGEADRLLESEVEVCSWMSLGDLDKIIEVFQKAQVSEVTVAGSLTKTREYGRISSDSNAVGFLARTHEKEDETTLQTLTTKLEERGIKLRHLTFLLPELLVPTGILARRKPNVRETKDIEFGWALAKKMSEVDIGQCLLIRDQVVLAESSMEGTDETILRGGQLANGGVVVVKASKPQQDLSFDVPAVGPETIETMKEVGASVLVVEAGRTLMFDEEETIQAADDAKIAVISLSVDKEAVADPEGLGLASMRLGAKVGQYKEGLVAAERLVTVTNSAPRVAVVGVGYFGKFHAEKYAALKESNLVAVVDVKPNRARRLAENFSCRAYCSHLDLIGKVDAASVAVPTYDHYLVARDLMEAGIHVLVEKPMTATLEEANSLIQIAKAKNLVCQVGHVERFNPALLAATEYVHQPSFLEAHRLAPFTGRETEVDVILDLMIHDIDIILSLVPCALKGMSVGGAKFLTPHTDICSVRLEFTNGCIASVTASRISSRTERRIRIFQPDSYLSVDYGKKRVGLFRKLPKLNPDGSPEVEYMRLPVADIDPLEEQLRDFADSVRTQRKPLVTGEKGLEALEVATAVSRLIRQQTERSTMTFESSPSLPMK